MNNLAENHRSLAKKAHEFVFPSDSYRHQIEVAAYLIAERRGFVPGHELDDWLEAEREIQHSIASPYSQ